MLKFTLTPYDVLFFGDAKPFNMGGTASSIFPPLPNTLMGSVFAKMFHRRGISYKKDTTFIRAVYGVFVERDGRILFPCPADIMSDGKTVSVLSQCPKMQNQLIDAKNTDIGDGIQDLLWLHGQADKSMISFQGFITAEGLGKWFRGEVVGHGDLVPSAWIYDKEERIGIHIDAATQTTTKEDGLYRAEFIRLRQGVNLVFWVDFHVGNLQPYFKDEKGIMDFYNESPRVLKLGGECRSVSYVCEMDDVNEVFAGFGAKGGAGGLWKMLFLSPGIFNGDGERNILQSLSGFVAGVLPLYTIAGINSKNFDRKTVRAISAGSVAYVQGDSVDREGLAFVGADNDFIGSNLVLCKRI